MIRVVITNLIVLTSCECYIETKITILHFAMDPLGHGGYFGPMSYIILVLLLYAMICILFYGMSAIVIELMFSGPLSF